MHKKLTTKHSNCTNLQFGNMPHTIRHIAKLLAATGVVLMNKPMAVFTPTHALKKSASLRALTRVSEMLDVDLKAPVDIVRLVRKGVEPIAIDALIKQGFSKQDVSWIVPARTLTHRRKNNQRLTPDESGRWIRAAKLQALAKEVFHNDRKAELWLHKSRKAFDNMSAMELMQTEEGALLVEELLLQVDTGFFA